VRRRAMVVIQDDDGAWQKGGVVATNCEQTRQHLCLKLTFLLMSFPRLTIFKKLPPVPYF